MKRNFSKKELPDSAVRYVLESLIPYTDANLKLAFSPSVFFNDLERIERQKKWQKQRHISKKPYRRDGIRNAFSRAKKRGYIKIDQEGIPRLTEFGKQRIRPYQPQKLGDSARLMVIFDIPEEKRSKRVHLRLLLKELGFAKIQQSVWVSKYDHRSYIKEEIRLLNLQDCIQLYECNRLQ